MPPIMILCLLQMTAQVNMPFEKEGSNMEKVIFASGCFWCTEAIFSRVKGVSNVVAGYTGGESRNPTYGEVCTGDTGHAEACLIEYDPDAISLEDLLKIFFNTHNPTTLNRQGADRGTQYRSAIFYSTPEQKAIAEKILRELESAGIWDDPVVTQIEALTRFYPAEISHQDYYANNKNQAYCRMVITPKIEKFNKVFASLKKNP